MVLPTSGQLDLVQVVQVQRERGAHEDEHHNQDESDLRPIHHSSSGKSRLDEPKIAISGLAKQSASMTESASQRISPSVSL